MVLYFTYLPRGIRTTDWQKFWVTYLLVRLVDVINCALFYRNRLTVKGFGFCEGSKFDHWIAMSPLTQGGTTVRL